MATNNSVDTHLNNTTGTGKFVGDTSPTLITPILGTASATSIGFNPTTNGIIGTNTNNDASSGYVGEIISSVIPYLSSATLVTNTEIDVTSISLTAGDWDVWGNVFIVIEGTATEFYAWISNTSATIPDRSTYVGSDGLNSVQNGLSVPQLRFSLSTTTTIYLSCISTFVITGTVCGGIYARRVR